MEIVGLLCWHRLMQNKVRHTITYCIKLHRGWVFEKVTLYKCDGDHKYEPEEDVMVPNET